MPSTPDLVYNGEVLSTNQEKANAFCKYYKDKYKESHHPNFDIHNREQINLWYDTYFNQQADNNEDIAVIDPNTYYKILHTQKNSSPGYDNIPWSIVKQLDVPVHEYIIKGLEFCLNQQIFLDEWKKGTIINLPKSKGDHTLPENYRPITLLPVLGKVYEKIIRTMLTNSVEAQIPNHQFGFREKHSTMHPLTILASNVETAKHQNLKSAALFLDTEKAFDSVWHKGLLFKLFTLQVPRNIVSIIKNFLEHRKIIVKVNNAKSDEFTPKQGVPQGSPISPLLYNIYCYDIAANINHEDLSQYVLQFADDTALIAHGKSTLEATQKLQGILNSIEVWFQNWRLVPNPNKSQFMLFGHTINDRSPHVNLFNQQIHPKPTAKYLGIEIDAKLNFNRHTKIIKDKTIKLAKHFRSLTFKNQGIKMNTATKIYKSICRPVLEYGHVIYLNLKAKAMKNITVAETSSLRAITKMRHPQNSLYNPSNELLYRRSCIQPIEQRLQELNSKFAHRTHNMEIIEPLCRKRENDQSKFRHPNQTMLEKLLGEADN